jgi:hypothetical protein
VPEEDKNKLQSIDGRNYDNQSNNNVSVDEILNIIDDN